jgi:hypothetical protein
LQLLEEQNIESLNVPQVRSKLGIVSQEPVLFDRSLADNIRYGANDRAVTMDEVVEAAKKANIHGFICSLPQVIKLRIKFKRSSNRDHRARLIVNWNKCSQRRMVPQCLSIAEVFGIPSRSTYQTIFAVAFCTDFNC